MGTKEIVHSVKTTPPPRFFQHALSATNIGLSQAVSEIIANSIDWHLWDAQERQVFEEAAVNNADFESWINKLTSEWGDLGLITLPDGEKRVVEVKILNKDTNPEIMIIDNGVGMNCEELSIALTPSEKLTRKRIRTRKGMYNMGLKAGWVGLGNKIVVKTKSIKSETSFYTEIDTRDFAQLTEWEVDITERADVPKELTEMGFKHGTVIIISELYNKNQDWETGKWGVTRNFSAELKNVNIKWEGDECAYEDPEMTEMIVNLTDKDLFVKDDLGNGKRGEEIQITGFIGLLKKSDGGIGGDHGFHTTRHGQLIEAYHNDGTRKGGLWPYPNPNPNHRRLFGWIELNMVPPNFHKKGWNTESLAWNDVKEKLKPILEGMIIAASKRVGSEQEQLEAQKIVSKIRTSGLFTPTKATKKQRKKVTRGGKESKDDENQEETTNPFMIGEKGYTFLEPYSNDDDTTHSNKPWEYTCEDCKIILTMNILHPIWKKVDPKILHLLAQIDAFCEIMGQNGRPFQEVSDMRFSLYQELFEGGV